MSDAGRFRLSVAATVATLFALVECGRALVWGGGRAPASPLDHLVTASGVLWLLPAVNAVIGLVGLLTSRGLPAPDAAPSDHAVPGVELCFRIVTRGTNERALRATVAATREVLAGAQVAARIEVVSEVPVELDAGPDLTALVVPTTYTTSTGALYKARALHYALGHSDLPPDGWILHLDEESHPTPSLLAGVVRAVAEEEAAGTYRIGQGAILYHRSLVRHPVLTLADMVRTGDDLGRFQLQHRLGYTIFGLHGSFILVRNSVEQAVGFDLGPEGSIAEDSFWALCQMRTGARSRWVDGWLEEQSPQSVADFVRQRRRWYAGLLRVVAFADTPGWLRGALALFMAAWASSWVALLGAYLNLGMGLRTPLWLAVLFDLSMAVYLTTYLVGLRANLRAAPPRRRGRRGALYVAQVALLPVFSVLEALGPVAGLALPERGFAVIRK
jgi:egghead protein (zeste-white 4 protein)